MNFGVSSRVRLWLRLGLGFLGLRLGLENILVKVHDLLRV
jgi:hypothetical protein